MININIAKIRSVINDALKNSARKLKAANLAMESQKRECEQAVKEANALLLQAGGSAQNFKAQTDEFFLITPLSEQVYFYGYRASSILTNSD